MSFLDVNDLKKTFAKRPDLIAWGLGKLGVKTSVPPVVRAVRDASFSVRKGEILGLIGESGCGKSTIARMLAGITAPTAGRITLDGHDVVGRDSADARRAAMDIQMVFQDAAAAMNPRYKVQDIIAEAPVYHGRMKASEARQKVREVLEAVSMGPDAADRFPHQFSGGQRQRIGIARALAMNPKLLICDESVAALDVSIQAQVINLFLDLRDRFDLTYVFISHDLSVVRHIADRVAIMYLGEIVESAPADQIFASPQHPVGDVGGESAHGNKPANFSAGANTVSPDGTSAAGGRRPGRSKARTTGTAGSSPEWVAAPTQTFIAAVQRSGLESAV